MLDRASTFADPEIVRMLRTQFIPVAIDQACQRRQKDSEGEFYRFIAGQGPRSDFRGTTQGFYIATPMGKLLLYNNNRHPEKVRRLMKEKLELFASNSKNASPVTGLAEESVDSRYNLQPPEGGLVVRVRAKILSGYEPTTDQWRQIFQSAVSRDNLWITGEEAQTLSKNEITQTLRQRIARFHLVDNTRGEPAMWKPQEIRQLELRLQAGQLTGTVHLETKDGSRGYQAQLKGSIDVKDGKIEDFELVALGDCWGDGPYTGGGPEGRFPLAISFTLADGSDIADRVPPQGSRGWLDGYLSGQ